MIVLFFSKPNGASCDVTRNILMMYERASAQKLYFQKSVISFSPNFTEGSRGNISNLLGLSNDVNHDSYLGLPSFVG